MKGKKNTLRAYEVKKKPLILYEIGLSFLGDEYTFIRAEIFRVDEGTLKFYKDGRIVGYFNQWLYVVEKEED